MRIVTLTESQLDILFSHTSSRSQAISSGKSEIGQFMNNKWNLSTIRSEFLIFLLKTDQIGGTHEKIYGYLLVVFWRWITIKLLKIFIHNFFTRNWIIS